MSTKHEPKPTQPESTGIRISIPDDNHAQLGRQAQPAEMRAARALDPRLHTHPVLLNFGAGAEAEPAILPQPLYANKKLLARYRRALLAYRHTQRKEH